jgi:hypothetical protein
MPNPPVAPCFESMPCNGAAETVNEVLPLHAALREGVLAWWHRAYLSDNSALVQRFVDEARASLPAIPSSGSIPDTDEVYGAVALQRLRLHQDQQVPEWGGDGR